MAGSEIEFYVFEDSYEGAKNKNYHDLQPMGYYIEDYHIFQGTKEESTGRCDRPGPGWQWRTGGVQ